MVSPWKEKNLQNRQLTPHCVVFLLSPICPNLWTIFLRKMKFWCISHFDLCALMASLAGPEQCGNLEILSGTFAAVMCDAGAIIAPGIRRRSQNRPSQYHFANLLLQFGVLEMAQVHECGKMKCLHLLLDVSLVFILHFVLQATSCCKLEHFRCCNVQCFKMENGWCAEL